ncbi:hypothetical protein AHAS_Ahas18G0299000 [Arachis hypogaea]
MEHARMEHLECEYNLPVDLLREILVRFPVRLLWQLKIVCRSWNSLISSPEFAMHHLQRSTLTHPPPLLLCWKVPVGLAGDIKHCSSQSLILDRQHQPQPVSHPGDGKFIRGSCNGLLCLSEGFPYKTLTLLNPSTRSVSPSVPFEGSDECGNDFFCGFGYDILHDQYKLVMGCCASSRLTDSKVRSGAIVFTFGANPSWKTVDHPVFPYDFRGPRNEIFVSGTLNWLVCDPTSSTIDSELEWFVLTFDLETELFGRFCLPITRMHRDFCEMPPLQVHNNCLSVCYRTPYEPIICTLWIMKEHGDETSWIQLFAITSDVGIDRGSLVAPLYISEDHNLLALDTGQVLVCNLRQNQLVSRVRHRYDWVYLYRCLESLVSPSHYCGLN